MPESKLKLLNWNIQTGNDSALFGNNWKRRKAIVSSVLLKENADILCLQEAQPAQLDFLKKHLPGYESVGLPRDDGKIKGETCSILFKSARLRMMNHGTFWLSDMPDTCLKTWDWPFKRVCTWIQLREKVVGEEFFVFNTHFPLNPVARVLAARSF